MKKCKGCLIEFDLEFFPKHNSGKDGHRNFCKKCISDNHKIYYNKNKEIIKTKTKEWRKKNPEKVKINSKKNQLNPKIKEYYKKWSEENKQHLKEYIKNYYKNNKEEIKKYKKEYAHNNLEKRRIKQKEKRKDPKHRIRHNISNLIRQALLRRNSPKNGMSTFKNILNYSIEEFVAHIESKFNNGMNWNNYGMGKDKWNIDHVIPDSWFKYTSYEDEDFKACWDLKNLQPMWQEENLRKNNRYIK